MRSEPAVTTISAPAQMAPQADQPTWLSALSFAAKAGVFRARRSAIDVLAGPRRLDAGPSREFSEVVASSETPLWSESADGEQALQLGKVHNLRIACRALDGLVIPAGAVFSFWRQVGPPHSVRGFAAGRMLKEGCMMPAIGGGLCQLSNALYAVALDAGCRIVERHAHSRIVPGSVAAVGRDATVAWNYVDLRFAPTRELRLAARMDKSRLTVALFGKPTDPSEIGATSAARTSLGLSERTAQSCASCGEIDCHMHRRQARMSARSRERRAFLVDEAWPELRDYVASVRRPEDWLGRPLGWGGSRAQRYGWTGEGFDRAFDAPIEAVQRSLAIRRTRQGAARRQAELASAKAIAERLARRLSRDVTAVTVAQSFLPFLWQGGHLGGRDVNVLMTRLPSAVIHERLDAAFAAHPERGTLSDFRWPAEVVRAEAEALANADRIITPHAEIAALFGARAVHLPWASGPPREARREGPIRCIGFPGPTIARKGAFAVREAARALGLEVARFGAELEGDGFWDGVRTRHAQDWTGIDAVVQPAWAEEQPRRLLAALAAGIPVFASAACGLGPRPGLTIIPADDPSALIAALNGAP
jgi:hypothetical protein